MHFSKLLVLLLILSVPCMAKIKVVQKSAKKTPTWVNTTEKDYIITSAISDNLEKAKQDCIDNIKKYIIDAVAQNVKSSSTSTINQETVNSEIVNFLDKYSYTYETQSANVPYMTGISVSKIEDFYWEKREDKDTRKISYLYCVKYPFPSLELKKLVHEFEKRDKDMDNKYKALESEYGNITSIEQIGKAIIDLNGLTSYFFDDIRKKAAQNLQRNYQELYKQIGFKEISNKLGCYTFTLVLNGKPVATSQRPVLKAETVTQLRAEQAEEEWNIYYDYATCSPSEENPVTITFRIGGRPLAQTFYVDVKQTLVQIRPTKEVYLTAQVRTDSSLRNIAVRMNIESTSKKAYTIRNITLNVPGFDRPLFIDDLKFIINTPGSQIIEFNYPEGVKLLAKQNYTLNLLRGYMEVVNEEGIDKRVDFSLPFRTNW